MPIQNQSYSQQNYISSLQSKPKINLFDFSKKSTQPVINTRPQSLPNSTSLNKIRSQAVINEQSSAKPTSLYTKVMGNI